MIDPLTADSAREDDGLDSCDTCGAELDCEEMTFCPCGWGGCRDCAPDHVCNEELDEDDE